MTHDVLTGIVLVLVLGIGSQWLAWRIRVPSILLLLVVGFIAGPVTRIIDPAGLQGDWVFAFVSISIGVILFEGGLSLRLSELREVGTAVLNLITIGVMITWTLASLGAYFILGLNISLAILLGAILTVTGPTVVIPLLRHVRPTGRVRAIAKWEGITIDPVGAILAVLVLDTILILNDAGAAGIELTGFGPVALHAVKGLLLTITTSIGISAVGAATLIILLRRRLVPDYLQSSIALAIVVGTFALSNVLQQESGLLEVTLLGIIMANQKYVPTRRISDFKEDLQVLLIAALFIVLSARLELTALEFINGRAIIFLVILIVLVRPIAVWVSAFRTTLSGRETTFLAWIAPRGIVAAAVASLFSFELEEVFPAQAESLVPIVFLIIVGTVAVYGLTLSPMARYLGLADQNPNGLLILGAHAWARKIASTLQDLGIKVIIIDINSKNIDLAKQQGLDAEIANAVSETVLDELDLNGIGNFLAMTPNDEVNTLAALNFTEIFESNDVLQLDARIVKNKSESDRDNTSSLRGRSLFGEGVTFFSINEMYDHGAIVEVVEITSTLTYEMIREQFGEDTVLLFAIRGSEVLINASDTNINPVPGDKIVLLAMADSDEAPGREDTFYSRLVADAGVLNLSDDLSFADVVSRAAAEFAVSLPISADRLAAGFIDIGKSGAMPVSNGVALPHYRLNTIDEPALLVVRSEQGIEVESGPGAAPDGDTVSAIFFLVSPEERPGQHLRTLANLAGRIDDRHFIDRWNDAKTIQELKEVLLHPDHYAHLDLARDSQFEGMTIGEVRDSHRVEAILVGRNGDLHRPDAGDTLEVGDHVTVSGSTRDIVRFREVVNSDSALVG
ncbi:MAG: PTS transporter subunit EIIA [Rhodothermales bacterium]|nr:PTS transporter subunit EIIA [Rhodothermales bacterium]